MPMSDVKTDPQRMEKIVSLCKRRGFIFQSSEIYGGLNGAWDYGPLGVELKRNLKDYWWRTMVHERDDIVGMDGSIIMHPAVWKASGHVDTFSDPMVDCLITKKRFRADQIEAQSGIAYSWTGAADSGEEQSSRATVSDSFSVLLPAGKPPESARKVALQFYGQRGLKNPELLGETTQKLEGTTRYNPENGSLLTEPRSFNLMFKTYVGATEDETSITYLRPETAQSIFVQFKNVLVTSRQKLPFGIAQIGKAFRNEINPRNYTFRSREFEQMELEYFCRPEQGMELLEYWKEERLKFYENIGIPRDKLHVLTVPDADRAFYSKGTYDIEYQFPFGIQELEGVAYRTDYDLSQHQKASGKPLEYFDEETKQRLPFRTSSNRARASIARCSQLLCEAYDEDTAPDEKGKQESRIVLRFHPRMAPIKCAVFPLLKNKEPLVAKAREVVALLRPHMHVFYDEGGAIGRRYRRQDEIGTPFGVTIDFDTLGENGDELKDTVIAT